MIKTKYNRATDGRLMPYYVDPLDDDRQYHKIIAGVAWPIKGDGFLVVLGKERKTEQGKHLLRVMFEINAPNVPMLYQSCSVARPFYCVSSFYGDTRNRPMQQFWSNINEDKIAADQIWLNEAPYVREKETNWRAYLESVRAMIPDPKRLFFGKCNQLKAKLAELPENVASMKPEDFPAITALAYAVCAMELIE